MRKKNQGFTLYELLLTLLLVGLLVSLAVPSMGAFIASQRQSVEINALFHSIHLARKESIVSRKVVSLCPSDDGLQCSASRDWSSNWLLFENTDRDSPPRIDPGEAILRRHQVAESLQIKANRRGFTLRATHLRATNGTIVVCDAKQRIRPKALVVSYTGRPRVARHSPDGELYSCAD